MYIEGIKTYGHGRTPVALWPLGPEERNVTSGSNRCGNRGSSCALVADNVARGDILNGAVARGRESPGDALGSRVLVRILEWVVGLDPLRTQLDVGHDTVCGGGGREGEGEDDGVDHFG